MVAFEGNSRPRVRAVDRTIIAAVWSVMGGNRDRYGEPVDDSPPVDDDRHVCDHGWLGTTSDGRPVPCLRCKPHLRLGFARVYDDGNIR